MRILFFLGVFLVVNTASAQWNQIVKDSVGACEGNPRVTLHPDYGQTYVTWFNSDTTGQTATFDFRVQVLDSLGDFLLPAQGVVINSNRIHEYTNHYDIEVDNLNNLVTATADEQSGIGILNIVANKIDNNGNFIWPDSGLRLIDSLSIGGFDPEIGILSTNESVVVWNAKGISKNWIAFQKITTTGNLVWNNSPIRIIDSSFISGFSRPQIIPLANDEFIILYVSENGTPVNYNIYAQRFNSDGDPLWANPIQISAKVTDDRNYPAIVSDGNMGAYISFLSVDSLNHQREGIYAQHIDVSGNLWNTDKLLPGLPNPALYYYSPILRFENGMQYPIVLFSDNGAMIIQSLDSLGNFILGPNGIGIFTQSLFDTHYDMRCVGDGMIIIYESTFFGWNNFEAVKIDFEGNFMWTPNSLIVSTDSREIYPRINMTPAIQIPGSERVFMVWEDWIMDTGIYQWNLNPDGSSVLAFINDVKPTEYSTGIYPNPSAHNQQLEINSLANDEITLQIISSTGQLIESRNYIQINSGLNIINLSDLIENSLTTGIYLLTLKGQLINSTFRLIKE
ncbi:MAG: T9SS type A sorting domain-containing protein [Bacteroidota bacterium]